MGLFDFIASLQTPLDHYGIETQPTKPPVKPDDSKKVTNNPIFNGKQYVRTEADINGNTGKFDWETIDTRTQRGTGEKMAVLNAWDIAFLNEKFGRDKWNQALAQIIKSHWADGDSAATIEKRHRDGGGVLEHGFSERNVKNYIWAFNRALEKSAQPENQ